MPRGLPPARLIADPMQGAMMSAAERHDEFVADLAAQRAPMGKAQVMWIGGRASADQARLSGDEPRVLLVAVPARLADREHTLVDAGGHIAVSIARTHSAGAWFAWGDSINQWLGRGVDGSAACPRNYAGFTRNDGNIIPHNSHPPNTGLDT
jgi:hypothetical protein